MEIVLRQAAQCFKLVIGVLDEFILRAETDRVDENTTF